MTTLGTYKTVLLLPLDPAGKCLACLCGGATFCLRVGCNITAHEAASKQDLGIEGIVAVQRDTYTVFQAPLIGKEGLDNNVLQHLTSGLSSLQEWSAAFSAVSLAIIDSDGANVDPSQVRRAQEDVRLAINFTKTPGKGTSTDWILDSFSPYNPSEVMPPVQPGADNKQTTKKHTRDLMAGVELALGNVGQLVERLKTTGQKSSENVDRAVTLLRNRIDGLAQVTGNLDHSGATFEAPTVCGVLGMLDAAVAAL